MRAAGPDCCACRHFSQMWHDRISAGTFNGTMFQLTGAPAACQAAQLFGHQHKCTWSGLPRYSSLTVVYPHCHVLQAWSACRPQSWTCTIPSGLDSSMRPACRSSMLAPGLQRYAVLLCMHSSLFQLLPEPVSTTTVAHPATPCSKIGDRCKHVCSSVLILTDPVCQP